MESPLVDGGETDAWDTFFIIFPLPNVILGIIGILFITLVWKRVYRYITRGPSTYLNYTKEQAVLYEDRDRGFSLDKTDIYVINLERAEERRNNVLKQFMEHGIQGKIFKATDGKQINISDEKYKPYLKHMRWWYTQDPKRIGHFACFLSHMRVYQEFLQSDKPYALIFEDDMELLPSFKQLLHKHMRRVPDDWDVVLLGYHIDDDDERVYKGNLESRLIHGIINPNYFTGLQGYIINQKSVKKLLTMLPEHKWLIDWNMGMEAEQGNLKIYGVYPPIVCQPAVYTVKMNGLEYTQHCKRDMGGMMD